MSVRVYSGPHADRRRGPSSFIRVLPWALAGATIVAQIGYPLVEGADRRSLTVLIVGLFFLASLTHALVWRGLAWTAGFVVVTVGGGLLVEAVGVSSGWPFGDYAYGDLTSQVAGVPWIIPLAWSMMGYPALIAARALCTGTVSTPLVGALALASWDLFLDPMMTAEGYWRFTTEGATSLPHLTGVPLSNFAGWLLVSFVMMLVLDRLPRSFAPDGQPALMYLWTYVSSVVANLVFLDRPWVALYGGVVMGAVAVPYAWVLWVGRD